MLILVLAHRVPYPPNKGEKIRTYHQIEYLVSCGHEVVVYAVQHGNDDIEHAMALSSLLDIEVIVEKLLFRRLRLLVGLFTSQSLSVCNFRVSRLQQRFDSCMIQDKPDVVLCTGSAMASYIFRNPHLNSMSGKNPILIMDFMDLDSDKWDQYRRHTQFPMTLVYQREAWLLSRYERKINSRFASCLFVTRNEKDMFLAREIENPERVLVVGNGVDMKAFHPDEKSSCLQVLSETGGCSPDMVFAGVMDYLPNEDAVCWFVENVWARVRDRWPDARFTIVGMSPSTRVRQLDQHQGVEVTGKVDDVLPYFHRATVFIAPLRMARGLQNKVLQSFAAGLPVITTALGAEGIDCVDGEHLLIAESTDEYMAALERLLNESTLYHSIRKNALCLVRENYSWQARNAALLECLNDDFALARVEP